MTRLAVALLHAPKLPPHVAGGHASLSLVQDTSSSVEPALLPLQDHV